jgi:diguanylate cyclase (GGDEF)-like protein/PAS domain S-box-containing protein
MTSDLTSLFERLPIGAYRFAMDGKVLHMNSALLKLHGFSTQQELRSAFGDYLPYPYLRPGRREEFRRLLDSKGFVQNFESEMIHFKSGKPLWVREHSRVVQDDNGFNLYYEGTVEDITEVRNAQDKLQRSENLLRNLMVALPDLVWIKDLSGAYLMCNPSFAANLGVSPEAVVGTSDWDWSSAPDAAHYAKTDQIAITAGGPVVFEEDFGAPDTPFTAMHRVIKTPLRDSMGDIIGTVGTAHSIQHRKEAEQLLRDTSEQLELALMGADLGRWEHELLLESGYRLDNKALGILGRDLQEGTKPSAWGHLVHPEDLPGALHAMQLHLSGAAPSFQAEYRAKHADGRWVWLSSRGKVVQFSQDGQPLRMAGTVMDVTARKLAELQLRATQAELQATLYAMPDLLIEYSDEGRCRAIHNSHTDDMISPKEFQIGKLIFEVLPKEAAEITWAALQEAKATGRSSGMQYSLQLPQGQQWYELSAVRKPTEPGDEGRLICIVRNITERKEAENAIAHLAFHDALTGLPNRRMLNDRLQNAVLVSQRNQRYGALLFLDLDNFKELNDTRGHEIGDLLLQEVSCRLLQNVRSVDTVARLGGDEFIVLLQDLGSVRHEVHLHVSTVAHKILASLNEPHDLDGAHHTVTPSIGIALFNNATSSPEDLMKQADQAMYRAKQAGRNTARFFEPDAPR